VFLALLAFIQGSHAFLFWWWIPLPIFVINGHGGGSSNCVSCAETTDQFNKRNSDCIGQGYGGGAKTGCVP
jgi:hypothetical protein